MLLGDMATIFQYKLPVKIIVYNNRSLGMVKLEMEVGGMPDNETDMVNPDFAMIAHAMGYPGKMFTNLKKWRLLLKNVSITTDLIS